MANYDYRQPGVRTAVRHGVGDDTDTMPKINPIGRPSKRRIPKDHQFDPKALKPLVKMLWSMSVSLGHALTAHRQFTRLKSVSISPDGLIGGRGYVMPVKDVRASLFQACENLSAIIDTVHDEITAPHWQPKLTELERGDKSVKNLLQDAQEWRDNPEEESDEELEEVEDEAESRSSEWSHPATRTKQAPKRSGIPQGGDNEVDAPSQGPHPALKDHPENPMNEQRRFARYRRANSTLPISTEPGGPRVDHLDRGEPRGPFGSYNKDEPLGSDEWARTEGVSGEPMSQNEGNSYAYPSTWSGETTGARWAASSVPDSNTDRTPTEAWDFGIGYGNGDDAHGQGAGGYGLKHPETGNYGVYGPEAELPSDPGGKLHDNEESDTTPTVEHSTSNSGGSLGIPVTAAGLLPNDTDEPVARSDYFRGPSGNDVSRRSESRTPGENFPQPARPIQPRPSHRNEHMFAEDLVAEAELPGDESGSGTYSYNADLGTGVTNRVEQTDQPYVKWDDNTKNMRPDYNYQRTPIQGPYTKQEG